MELLSGVVGPVESSHELSSDVPMPVLLPPIVGGSTSMVYQDGKSSRYEAI